MNNSFWKGFASGAVALLVGGTLVGSLAGFQATSQKVGVVNFKKVLLSSDIVKQVDDASRQVYDGRMAILKFVADYRVMKREDALRFRDLSVKVAITEPEKIELEKLKATAVESEKRLRQLESKNPLTDDEQKAIEEFRNRQALIGELLPVWQKEFSAEYSAIEKRGAESIDDAITAAVQEIGKKQGFTLVHSSQVVPYGANDISDEVIKTLNRKK